MRPTSALGILGSLIGWMLVLCGTACTPEPVHDAAFSFSPYCGHPVSTHLCVLAYVIPASDDE
jgi:hypothetical protein